MANVIHRTTLEFRRSVNEPDFPEPVWKHNPDMSAVDGVPFIYWKTPTDWAPAGAGPVEMTVGEKAVVDAAILEAARDSEAALFDDTESAFRSFALAVLGEINRLSDAVNATRQAALDATNLANFQVRVSALGMEQQRTIAQLRETIRSGFGG